MAAETKNLMPLYDKLKQKIPVNFDWTKISVVKLSDEHLEIIYALILHFYITEEKTNKIDLFKALDNSSQKKIQDIKKFIPYNGKLSDIGKGIFYQLNSLPLVLQQVIAAYIQNITSSSS